MKLAKNKIDSCDSWFAYAPPKGGEDQWKSGRSAMELANYMTADLPYVPKEIEAFLSDFVPEDTVFGWDAEHVTSFASYGLGIGEGRNHDAVMWCDQVFVGIEGKADESLGNGYVASEYIKGSENKKKRVRGLCKMIWGDEPENYPDIRYQLLTASTAILLEASKPEHRVKNAVFLVLVFKREGSYHPKRIEENNLDIRIFLERSNAEKVGDYYKIPTVYGKENGIDLYFKKIEIEL